MERPRKQIAIVGLGALGSEVCRQLSESHISADVFLIDEDRLEARNIPSSSTYADLVHAKGETVFSQCKTDLLQAWLSDRHASINWHSRPCEIADLGWVEIRKMDLLITCTDNISSRAEAAFMTRTLGVPMLDGGVKGDAIAEGRVAWYPSTQQAACYLCGLSESRRAEVLSYLSSTNHGCATIPLHRAMDASVESSLSIRSTASEIIRQTSRTLLSEQEKSSTEVRVTPHHTEESLKLTPSRDCPWHDQPPHLIPVDEDTPFASLSLSPDCSLSLPWPICISSRCDACGHTCDQPMRLGRLREKGRCPSCHATGRLTPLEVVDRINADGKWSQKTPRQLGLPPAHLLILRKRIQQNSGQRSV